MAAKLSPAMIAMIVEASHFRHHEIIGGNARTLQAVVDRGLAEVRVNTTGGANTVHLTPVGYDTAVTHRPAVEPVEDIVTVTEVVSEADTLAEVAEVARRAHFANATSENPNRSFCLSDTYRASHAALMAAIVAAYPDMDAEAVYGVWVDCNEDIAYCVNVVREQAIEDAADAARMAAEDAADAAHDAEVDAARLNLSSDYRRFLTGRENDPRTALALAHAHATLTTPAGTLGTDELNEFTYTLPTEVYGVPVERVVRALHGDVNVYDDGVLLCGVTRYFEYCSARRAVAVLARRILPDVMTEVDAQDAAPIGRGEVGDPCMVCDGPCKYGRCSNCGGHSEHNIGCVQLVNAAQDADGMEDMRLHTFITGEVAPVPLVGPRGPVSRDDSSGNGAVLWWDRTIAGQPYRFVLGVNTDNAAVVATVSALGTGKPVRVIPFRKPVTVAPRVTQPPVVTLPPRTVAGGKRSVPRKRSGRRSSGWRKAGKGGK